MQTFCPDAEIKTMQDNVKEPQFDIAFMKTFDVVLNGLDNVEARRHVNRLCLAAEVPLVESGTTGYKGQVRCRSRLCLHDCCSQADRGTDLPRHLRDWYSLLVACAPSNAALCPCVHAVRRCHELWTLATLRSSFTSLASAVHAEQLDPERLCRCRCI